MEIVKTPFGTFNFYINYIASSEENFFHISFVDKANKMYAIVMKESDGKWIISNYLSLPSWITGLHEQFNAMIAKEILKTYQQAV